MDERTKEALVLIKDSLEKSMRLLNEILILERIKKNETSNAISKVQRTHEAIQKMEEKRFGDAW